MTKQRLILKLAERLSRGEMAQIQEPSPERQAPQQRPPNDWEDFLVNLATNYLG